MRSIDYGINDYEIIYEKDKNNFIEQINGDKYLVHCRYDGGDNVMQANSDFQAFIIYGLLMYGIKQDTIRVLITFLLK